MNQKQRHRIKKGRTVAIKLLLWFMLIEFPAESLLVYVSYYSAKTTLEQELEEKFEAIAVRQTGQINKYLGQELEHIENYAELPDLLRFAGGEDVELQPYKRLFSRFKALAIITSEGEILYSSDSLRWQNGANIQVNAPPQLVQLFSRTHTILQSGFSDFYFDNAQNTLVGYVAAPLRSAEGRELGVIIGQIAYENIEEVMSDYTGMGETGASLLAIQENDAIRILNRTRTEEVAFARIPSSAARTPIFHEALLAKSGSGIQTDYRGKRVFAHWGYVPAIRAALVIRMDTEEAFKPIGDLRTILLIIIGLTLLVVVFAAFSAARTFTLPIRKLTRATQRFAGGDMKARAHIDSNDEIGTLAIAFNEMAEKIEEGQRMLAEHNTRLEQKVNERTEELLAMNEELKQSQEELSALLDVSQEQNLKLTSQNLNITSSIRYAERIQRAMLPQKRVIREYFKEDFFIFYKPRDIVSGDFYWFQKEEHREVAWLAVVDCTGHGVPGALMSILGGRALSAILIDRQEDSPAQALERLHRIIIHSLAQERQEIKDGMDIALCKIEYDKKQLTYAGARHDLCVFGEEGKLSRVRGARRSIGEVATETTAFTDVEISFAEEPQQFYLFSDGYRDQIGGKRDRKFLMKNFLRLLKETAQLKSFEEQKAWVDTTLKQHQGDNRQIDDILVMGFKLS